MTHIELNKRIIENINNENLISLLNNMIDEELSHNIDEIDTDFVDKCVNALLELETEQNNFIVLVPLISSEKFLKKITGNNFKKLNIFARTAIIAAIIAGTTFTANAGIQELTGVNIIDNIVSAIEQKFNTDNYDSNQNTAMIDDTSINSSINNSTDEKIETTYENNSKSTASQTQNSRYETENKNRNEPIITDKNTSDQESSYDEEVITTRQQKTIISSSPVNQKPVPGNDKLKVTSLTADISNVKTDYIYGEKISYDGIILTVTYSDGSNKNIDINDCYYTKIFTSDKTANYTLEVIYESCKIEFEINFRPNEQTRGSVLYKTNDFDYLRTNSGAYITAYNGRSTNVTIDFIDSIKVISIGDNAFKGNTIIENCSIPYVTYIGNNAFEGCENLKAINYSKDVEHFGTAAFKNTGITNITISENITKIPNYLFDSCKNLKEVTLTNNVTEIGTSAFAECEMLEKVNGCKNIKIVNSYAFYDDSKVNFDTFPRGIEIVGDCSFYLCQKLNIGSLPQSIKHLGRSSFAYCTLLTELTIPKDITIIPYEAFRGCGATSVTINEGVTEIEDFALRAVKTKELRLPSTLKKLGADSIYSQTLMKIYLNRELEMIADTAIYPSKAVTLYIYPDSAGLDYAVKNALNYKIIEQEETK